MRQDILSLIDGKKDLTNVVILTFNINYSFIESHLIPRLNKNGYPSLTIFADAQCA